MISLFRSRTDENKESADQLEAESTPETEPKGVTPGKGRPTPKRTQRTTRPEPAPKTNKEARARMRERTKTERAEQYRGMQRGEEKYLFPRDQGPIRKLVRDLVDSRRNAGTWFFGGTFVVVLTSFLPAQLRLAGTLLLLALIALFIVDGTYLTIRIRKLIKQKFSKDSTAQGLKLAGHCIYGVMRSVVFRRLRNPAPTVKIGEDPTS